MLFLGPRQFSFEVYSIAFLKLCMLTIMTLG